MSVLLEKLLVSQLVKKFLTVFENQMFITVVTQPITGPCSEPYVCRPLTPILWSIIGLSSHLHLDLLSGLFASGFCVPKLCMQLSVPHPRYLLFLIYRIKTEPGSVYMEPSYIDLWHVPYPKFVTNSGFLEYKYKYHMSTITLCTWLVIVPVLL